MISNAWAEILRCSACGSPYDVSDEAVVCGLCAIRFPVVDGIPVLIKDTTIGTSLEKIDYDANHGIGAQMIDRTGRQWKKIITQLGLEDEEVLEIGAGTGALTLGLLQHQAVRELTAIDVSHKFLRTLAAALPPIRRPCRSSPAMPTSRISGRKPSASCSGGRSCITCSTTTKRSGNAIPC